MRSSSLSLMLGLVVLGHFAACSAGGDGGGSGGGAAFGGSAASGGAGGTAGSTTGGSAGTSAGGSGGATGGSSATGGAAGASGGSGATAGAGGAGGSVADAGIPDVSFTYDGPVEQDGGVGDACAATTVSAEPAPLDMYIMLDNSGSMHEPQAIGAGDCNIGQGVQSKWCYSINALDQFFKATPAGNGVALQYFPKCWPSTAECSTGATCANAEVALAQLPGNLNALQASLNANAPSGTTPTEAALRGIVSFTQANKQPSRAMIGILITDGKPEACSTNVNTLAGIVQAHLQNNKIKTFVIGMTGADYSTLETIASPGGASSHSQYCGGGISPCFHYDVGNGNPAAFTAVLQAIQKSAVACQYNMPQSDAGIIDPSKVEVRYSVGGNPPPQTLPHVNDSTQCSAGGWYYDSNANPKVIYLCPSTCSVVQIDSKAKIDISLGCLGS